MNRRDAIRLAKGAVAYLYEDDPEFVQGGCSDVSEVIAAFLESLGVEVGVIYGWARPGRDDPFMHAWLNIAGERFDPVLWVFRDDLSRYFYKKEKGVSAVLYCELFGMDEQITELTEAMNSGKLKPKRPELVEEESESNDW